MRTWSIRYVEDMSSDDRAQEERLFQEIGPAVRAQGYFNRKQFLHVGEWKSPRSKGLQAHNTDSVVREITGLALGPSMDERLTTLTALQGVQDAVASALLTVWEPDTYTVTDRRALATLTRAGKFRATRGRAPYGLYLAVCRSIADALDIPSGDTPRLRQLDRALWKYSQTHD
ncbi:MAG: hypothetical protein ACRDH7_09840 [Actinomycetota bacterium]